MFPLEFGAREVALGAPKIFLGVPEMVPAMELELQLVRELARLPKIEPVLALGIAQGLLSQIDGF